MNEVSTTKTTEQLSKLAMDITHAWHTVDVMLGNGHSVQMDGYNAAEWAASTATELREYLDANEHIGLDFEMATWAMRALEDVTLKLMTYEGERDVEPEDVDTLVASFQKLSSRLNRTPNEVVAESIASREQDMAGKVSNNAAGFITRKQLGAYLAEQSHVRMSVDITTLTDGDEGFNAELGAVEQYRAVIDVFCSSKDEEAAVEWWKEQVSTSAEADELSATNVHFVVDVEDLDAFVAAFAARSGANEAQ